MLLFLLFLIWTIFLWITIEKENKLTIEYERSINELNDLIEEVKARLELAENGAEKTKILEIYDILDKKGKINA